MMATHQQYTYRNRQYGDIVTAELSANWEVDLSAMSDDYDPGETPAYDMLQIWSRAVADRYRDNMVPICWYVQSKDDPCLFESLPFQGALFSRNNFLTWFTTPRNTDDGEPIRWHELPVLDKRWDHRQGHKGGFFQPATGWKPVCLQPFVSVDYLLYLAEHYEPTL